MGLNLVTTPTLEPVTVEEIKDHLRIDIDTEDTLLSELIKVARVHCEKLQNKAYLTQTYDWYLDDFPDMPLDIPLPPLQSITHIKYTDTDGTETEYTSTYYNEDIYSFPGRINFAYGMVWPSVTLQTLNGVVIRFIAGYTNRAHVPREVKEAIKLLVGHLYEHREETTNERILQNIPLGIYSLLDMDRMITLP